MAGENKLSDKALRSFLGKPRDKQKTIADGKGLSVRLSTSGAVSFVFYYRIYGQVAPIWLTLGKYPDMSLKLAREMRDKCREWLAENRDPRIQIKIKADETLRPRTVTDALEYWLDNYAVEKRTDHEEIRKRFKKNIYPYVGKIPISDCKLHEWLSCFDRIKKRAPVMSAHIFLCVKYAIKFCRVRRYAITHELDDLVIEDIGSKGNKRERFLSIDELKDVWEKIMVDEICSCASIYDKRMMLLCLVFGSRMVEVRLSSWAEWDLKAWVWTVPKEHSKNRKEVIRPIPDGIRQFIVDLHEETKKDDFILGVWRNQKNISSSVGAVWRRLGHSEQWTLHDFRRTLSTYLNDMGVDFYVVEQLLGHAIKGVAGVYNRSIYLDKKSDALNMWVNYLNNLVKDNVVQFRKEVV